ncbi:MAG: hypothetical protein DIZ80_02485 [endosymbiont of Galathealinum brachiosum]|uniref:Porin n=1 Tax=endosymbiont of Galathealinum brachiosum TaxID=2200906 RepID=A0A370DLQ9_9GAMM|nr:MAG: hypothetical protein DIZ80_02485 [endosymbiont of Galathealinum brachiosum]
MIKKSHFEVSILLFFIVFLFSLPVNAVNWLMLQGTEPEKVTHRAFVFVQPSYTRDLSGEITAGPNAGKPVVGTTVAPWFDDDSALHFRRARAGVRGNFTGMARNEFTSKMNYFLLAEFAPNLLTYDFLGSRQRVLAADHISVTSNHINGARLRFGLFKTPGLEETYQGIVAQDYIEFTDFAAREVLERFTTGNTRTSPSGGTNSSIGTPVTESNGFNGARDWGIQVFDSFKQQEWDFSYAFMLGRGAGIYESDRPQDPLEQYYYLSAEQNLEGGKGPWKHGMKYYAWLQKGVRVFETDPLQQEFDRLRYGIGLRSQGPLFGMKARQRFDVGYMVADGMVFVGPAGGVKGGNIMIAAEDGNRSQAFSVDYGHFVAPKWELMLRWDKHELLHETDDVVWTEGDARNITTMTYGIQHHFTKKLKLAFNFIDKKVTAPNEPNPVVQNVVGSVGNRYSLQLTWIH